MAESFDEGLLSHMNQCVCFCVLYFDCLREKGARLVPFQEGFGSVFLFEGRGVCYIEKM